MARTTRGDHSNAVEFVHEDDGSVTARDLETGLARGGRTRGEALKHLAEVLILEEGGGEPIEDPEEFLRTELDVEPGDDRDLPEFLE